eukprot:GFUD01018681.1.p1 GENE.GFUD01018681.1~~GFUD01018681.1.p1  ORF type:complete len:343 (-),score=67.32 GFUD01018681.1:42-1070(-)
MSWITKLDNNMDAVEEAFDKFNDIAADEDIEDYAIGTSVNYQEMTNTGKMLNLLMASSLPLLTCSAYVVGLKIVALLIELRSISCSSSVLDPETLNSDEKKFSNNLTTLPCKILKFFMILLGLVLLAAIAILHFGVLRRWGIISDEDDFHAGNIASLQEKADKTFDVAELNMREFSIVKLKAMEELIHAPDYIQDFILSKIDRVVEKGDTFAIKAEKIDNIFTDLENKVLATLFSFCFISSSILSIWFWLYIITNKVEKRLFLFSMTAISCVLFLTCALTAMYLSVVQPYLKDFIHPGSGFIQETMLTILQEFGKFLMDSTQKFGKMILDCTQAPGILGLST